MCSQCFPGNADESESHKQRHASCDMHNIFMLVAKDLSKLTLGDAEHARRQQATRLVQQKIANLMTKE